MWMAKTRPCCRTQRGYVTVMKWDSVSTQRGGTGKVVAFKGSKHVYAVLANTRTQVTVLATMSAAGHYLRPMLIYPYKRIPGKNLF